MGDALDATVEAPAVSRVTWHAVAELRFRKVYFGRPVLQQLWIAKVKGEQVREWRDVPEVAE